MASQEPSIQNFSGGEQAPNMYGRYELPVYQNGARRIKNFIVEPQGSAVYRPGFQHVTNTRLNQVANLLGFQFNDEQAYVLEFTDRKLRFYRDNGVVTETADSIDDVVEVTDTTYVQSNTHSYANGDEIFISGLKGSHGLNGRSFLVADTDVGVDFKITTVLGDEVDPSAWTFTAATGTTSKVYEIPTPYTEAGDLFKIDITQDADTMYIVHPDHAPMQLTRTGHTSWGLIAFNRDNNPFGGGKPITTGGVTNANPAVCNATAHGQSAGDLVILAGLVDYTNPTLPDPTDEWHPYDNQIYKVATPVNANDFVLHDVDDNPIDTSSLSAISSTGTNIINRNDTPGVVAFYESRLWYAATINNPAKLFASKAPDGDTGEPRYDDFGFTPGDITDDEALNFTLADGEVNKIEWLQETDRLLMIGTFGAELKLTGNTAEAPITATSIKSRSVNHNGVAPVSPVNNENIIIYVQRGALTLRSFEFDALNDRFTSVDRNLVASHITESGIKQMAWQTSRPDLLWAVRNDGVLLGFTFKNREDVSGWHRHTTGSSGEDSFLSVTTLPRPTDHDQVWTVIERVYGGNTHRSVNYMNDTMTFPVLTDYFTGTANKAADEAKFLRAALEKQKGYIHLDSALTYDGSITGATLTVPAGPPALGDEDETFSTDVDVFVSGDVGREIRKKAIAGVGTGRAIITLVTDAQNVDCTILETFDTADALSDGNWYLTADTVLGLDHLEGRTVSVVADGAHHPQETVTTGTITLDYQASMVHVGVAYEGFLQPMSLEFGGVEGTGQSKPKNIRQLGIRFHDTLGAEFGTDLYRPEAVQFASMSLPIGNPTPLFTGIKVIPYNDAWERDKNVYIRQNVPLPCTVQMLVIYGETDND